MFHETLVFSHNLVGQNDGSHHGSHWMQHQHCALGIISHYVLSILHINILLLLVSRILSMTKYQVSQASQSV